jgi:hypothetical protein
MPGHDVQVFRMLECHTTKTYGGIAPRILNLLTPLKFGLQQFLVHERRDVSDVSVEWLRELLLLLILEACRREF